MTPGKARGKQRKAWRFPLVQKTVRLNAFTIHKKPPEGGSGILPLFDSQGHDIGVHASGRVYHFALVLVAVVPRGDGQGVGG